MSGMWGKFCGNNETNGEERIPVIMAKYASRKSVVASRQELMTSYADLQQKARQILDKQTTTKQNSPPCKPSTSRS